MCSSLKRYIFSRLVLFVAKLSKLMLSRFKKLKNWYLSLQKVKTGTFRCKKLKLVRFRCKTGTFRGKKVKLVRFPLQNWYFPLRKSQTGTVSFSSLQLQKNIKNILLKNRLKNSLFTDFHLINEARSQNVFISSQL